MSDAHEHARGSGARRSPSRLLLTICAGAVGGLSVAGCGDDGDKTASPAHSQASTVSSAEPTTTTTTARPVLQLSATGLGEHHAGAAATPVEQTLKILGPPTSTDEHSLCGTSSKLRRLRWHDFEVDFIDEGSGYTFSQWAIGPATDRPYALNPDTVVVPDQVKLPPGVHMGMTLAEFKTVYPTTARYEDAQHADTEAAFAANPSDPANQLRGQLAGPYADTNRIGLLGYAVDLLGC